MSTRRGVASGAAWLHLVKTPTRVAAVVPAASTMRRIAPCCHPGWSGRNVDQQDQAQVRLRLQRVDQRLRDRVVVEVLVLDVDEALGEVDAAQKGLEQVLSRC